MSEGTRAQAQAALKQANKASKKADLAAAERWSKVAERLVAAAEREAALPAQPVENEEELRAELRMRILRLADASLDMRAWEEERETYEASVAASLANGVEPPGPLRPRPNSTSDLRDVAKQFIAEEERRGG